MGVINRPTPALDASVRRRERVSRMESKRLHAVLQQQRDLAEAGAQRTTELRSFEFVLMIRIRAYGGTRLRVITRVGRRHYEESIPLQNAGAFSDEELVLVQM